MYLLENQDETRDFITLYKKDIGPVKYVSKKFRPRLFAPDITNSKDPIGDSYKEHLFTKKKNATLHESLCSDSVEENFKKLLINYPHLKKNLPEKPPDEDFIDKYKRKHLLSSVYQGDFGYLDIKKEEKIYYELPENSFIPETVSQKLYRNPRYFGSLSINKKVKPENCIAIDHTQRKILRVRTGDSEYQDTISKVGEKFFGPPIPLDFSEEHKYPSDCDQILSHASNRPVLSQIL